MTDRTYRTSTRVRYIEVPTFVAVDGGFVGSTKLAGTVVRVSRGTWDDVQNDYRAVVCMSSGVEVESALFYKEFEAVPLVALAGKEVVNGN